MSGSPILIQSGDSFKCIGICCGGPPLEGQCLLMRVLYYINRENYEEALSLFAQLPFHKFEHFSRNCEFMEVKRRFYMFMILSNALDQERFKLEHPEEYHEITVEFTCYGRISKLHALFRLQKSINKFIIETIEQYNDTNKFSYYVGISTNTEAFKIVRRAIDIFRELEGDFNDAYDIERIITQFVI